MSLLLLNSRIRASSPGKSKRSLNADVLEFESPSAAVIATRIPRLAQSTNWLIFLLVAATLLASGVIKVDRIVSAAGVIVADTPNIVLQPFDQTIVESIETRKGAIVHKGQVLARLNPTFSRADVTAIKDQENLFDAKAKRLQAEVEGVTYHPDPANPHGILQAAIASQRAGEMKSSLESFDEKINQLKAEIAGNAAQEAFDNQRLGIAVKIETLRQTLQDLQVGSLLNTMLANDSRLSIASDLARAKSDGAQAGRSLAAQQAEREIFIRHWIGESSQDLADTRLRLVQAQQASAKANLHNDLVLLTAPRDAIVLSIAKVSPGSIVNNAEPLIELVPIDVPLSVEADISGIDSGFVRPGDEVTIKFDTLPYLQYGSAVGTVRTISADSFNPETAAVGNAAPLPSRPDALYYKGDITIERTAFHGIPAGFRIMPGMPIMADVKVGTHSILSYFVAKVLPVAYESLREP